MGLRSTLIRALVRAAKLRKTELGGGTTIVGLIEGLLLAQFKTTVTNGRTVVETSAAGQSVRFDIPEAMSGSEIMTLAEEALNWLSTQTNPESPNLVVRPVKRLRVSFAHAQL